MTKEEIEQISALRKQGHGYFSISKAMGISVNTIKSYCKRHGMGGVQKQIAVLPTYERKCLCCGAGIVLIEGRKEKKFCSSKHMA
jgi:DNA-binding CsgD family transcriptional regulator